MGLLGGCKNFCRVTIASCFFLSPSKPTPSFSSTLLPLNNSTVIGESFFCFFRRPSICLHCLLFLTKFLACGVCRASRFHGRLPPVPQISTLDRCLIDTSQESCKAGEWEARSLEVNPASVRLYLCDVALYDTSPTHTLHICAAWEITTSRLLFPIIRQ